MDQRPNPSRRALAAGAALAVLAAGPARAAGAGQADRKTAGGTSFLPLEAVTAVVAGRAGRRAIMSVETGLDIPDEKLRARADLSRPRLRAAFAQSLQAYGAGLAPQEPPDADHIGRLFQRDVDRVLGRSGARLLLGAILVS